MALQYTKLSVPDALFRELDVLVKAHPEFGYRSASDAATEALREKVAQLHARAAARHEARLRDASEVSARLLDDAARSIDDAGRHAAR